MIVVRVLVGLLGFGLVVWTIGSAVKTVVLPRATSSVLTRATFINVRRVFDVIAGPRQTYEFRDRILAMYSPVALLALPALWVALVLTGFMGVFWGMGVRPWSESLIISGSSLLTLGFDRPFGVWRTAVSFAEAGIGLGLVSLMISYLPSIYANFSRREALVGMLEVRAGLPPSPSELLVRYHRIGWGDKVHDDLLTRWEQWFIEVEESHTSQPSLVFFRSPHPQRSWITAAGCVLDTAAIIASTLDREHDAQADIMLRTGWFCLRRICDFYGIQYVADPAPDDPISITREDFDIVCAQLAAAGVELKPDRDQCWRDFAGWRVNYDTALTSLCSLIDAPPAKWSSDRAPIKRIKPKVFRSDKNRVSRNWSRNSLG
ncbi:MAG: hypothetical protein JWM34_3557 [Ilumatobacteraceae bacterium]|nr:hypothetical protein [Ilumatobacteraceae bacterium]